MSTILIIDDSAEDRELFADLLKQAEPGVTVVACGDGEAGVRTARDQSFDCVLLDLRLDGEDGLEVLGQVQAVRPNLPVIVLTGQGSEKSAVEAFVAGAAYYLPKQDINAVTLSTAVARVIQHAKTDRELKSKRDALERSNRLDAVGQLAAGIAHDFNNQLGALRYCIELLKDAAVTDKLKERVGTALKIIDESANLASRMVSLTRQGDLLAKDVRLFDAFNDIRALAAASVPSEVLLEVSAPDGAVIVHCDPGQLTNALLNLILNASDAITANKSLGTVTLRTEQQADKLHLSVADTGIGMSKAVLAKCTDPFYSTKTTTNGTGLGLAMVQSFANDNSGELLINSEEGTGTQVTLILPVGTPQEAEKELEGIAPSPNSEHKTILVAEDQFMLALMTQEILEEVGFSVEIARDAESALELLSSGSRPDLILTDIKLPGMNGFQLADRAVQILPDVKIVYVTGYSDNPEFRKETLHGPFLQKPVEPGELVATISKVLNGR